MSMCHFIWLNVFCFHFPLPSPSIIIPGGFWWRFYNLYTCANMEGKKRVCLQLQLYLKQDVTSHIWLSMLTDQSWVTCVALWNKPCDACVFPADAYNTVYASVSSSRVLICPYPTLVPTFIVVSSTRECWVPESTYCILGSSGTLSMGCTTCWQTRGVWRSCVEWGETVPVC